MICSECKKPILSGESRYTAYEPEKFLHFECAKLPPRIELSWKCRNKPGEGKIAERVAELLSEALTAYFKEPLLVYPDMLWIQNNAFGVKWDLARWGSISTKQHRLNVSSWSRMGDCVKNGIEISEDRGDLCGVQGTSK